MEKDSLTVHIHVIKDDPAIVHLPKGEAINGHRNELRWALPDEQDNTAYSYALEIDEDAFKKLAAGKAIVIAHFHDGCECVGIFKFVNKVNQKEIITFCPDQAQPVSGAVPAYRCKEGLSAESSKTDSK